MKECAGKRLRTLRRASSRRLFVRKRGNPEKKGRICDMMELCYFGDDGKYLCLR